jgi:hypothetical protein
MQEPKLSRIESDNIDKYIKQEHPENMNMTELFDLIGSLEWNDFPEHTTRFYFKVYFVKPNGEKYVWLTIVEKMPFAMGKACIGSQIKERLKVELNKNWQKIFKPGCHNFDKQMETTMVKTIYRDSDVEYLDKAGLSVKNRAVRMDIITEVK